MEQKKSHEYFMEKAIKEAESALEKNEVPIGVVIVGPDNKIIASAHNLVDAKKSQTAHAEVLAINKAAKKIGDWRLDDYRIYVTLEPCAMCVNLILLSRFKELIYGADSPLFGFSLDKHGGVQLYRRDTLEITSGVLKEEAGRLLKQFFKKQRKKGELKKH